MSSLHKNRKRAAGFTLVELMVASSIMVIMTGLVVAMTSQVLKAWNQSMARMTVDSTASVAMDIIENDLQCAIFRRNQQQWMLVEKEYEVGAHSIGQSVNLKLFTSVNEVSSEGDGDICAVAYQLAQVESYSGSGNSDYVLFRAIEEPAATFQNLLGSGTTDSVQRHLSGGFWSEEEVTEMDHFLIGNVFSFRIYVYGLDAQGREIVLNDQDDDGTIEMNFALGGVLSEGSISQTLPLYADIELKVLSDAGLRILALPSLSGSGFRSASQVVREHGRTFVRRVHFPGAPL